MSLLATDAAVLRCPDCYNMLRQHSSDSLICSGCNRTFFIIEDVLSLLPLQLEEEKLAEDKVFAPGSRELQRFQGNWWRSIVGRLDILRFHQEILPMFAPGRFLELGGETCYASALFKAAHEQESVFASDVSPNTLRFLARHTTALFGAIPDVFVAVDAEHLPFTDRSFTGIFAQSILHHMPHPERALQECYRVLAPGGVAVLVDHCVPRHWRHAFAPIARHRSDEYGIQEELFRLQDWQRIIRKAGLAKSSLQFYRNPAYQRDPRFALAGHLIQRLPLSLAVRLFPVGLLIVLRQPV